MLCGACIVMCKTRSMTYSTPCQYHLMYVLDAQRVHHTIHTPRVSPTPPPLYTQVVGFLSNVLSRAFEFQADRFAVQLHHGPELKEALLVLDKENKVCWWW